MSYAPVFVDNISPVAARRNHAPALVERQRSIVSAVIAEPGRSLDRPALANYGGRFGFDFSRVRIHQGDRASSSAAAVGAAAYTLGRHIVVPLSWREGEFPDGLLAHELAHVAQQGAVDVKQSDDIWYAPAADESEADGAVKDLTNRGTVSVSTGVIPRLGRQTQSMVPGWVADLTMSQHVDRYQEIYYDLGYRPRQPGILSEWLRVRYSDGSLIDIHINEISDADPSADEVVRAMAAATLGRGKKIFPASLNRRTTPRLYAARQSALAAMDEYNVGFITQSMPAVLFIITASAVPLMGPTGGMGSSATRRALARGRRPLQPGGTAAQPAAELAQSAEQFGAQVGGSVARRTGGRMAAIVEQVTARGLSQNGAATATEAAVKALGLRTGPRVALPDGSVVITSVQLGGGQPVLVVQANGSVFQATADLVQEGLTVAVRNVTRI